MDFNNNKKDLSFRWVDKFEFKLINNGFLGPSGNHVWKYYTDGLIHNKIFKQNSLIVKEVGVDKDLLSDDLNCFQSVHHCFDPNRGLIAFDLGCNINPIKVDVLTNYTALLLNSGLNIKQIYAFEPLHYQTFEKKYRDNEKVSLIKKAVSDTCEPMLLYVPKAHGLSSLYHREVFKGWTDGLDKVPVECTTIDNFIKEYNIDQIDYLKIDVEGAEFLVLKGAKNALKDGRIITGQFEFGETLQDANTSKQEIIDFYNITDMRLCFTGDQIVVLQLSILDELQVYVGGRGAEKRQYCRTIAS